MQEIEANVKPGLSKRGDVDAFLAMDVLATAARYDADGRDIVHMEVGQPGAPAPKPVLEAATLAMADGRLGYTQAVGLPDLRKRIARHYLDAYGVDVPFERVVVTTGSSAGFSLAFLAALDAGDAVLTTAPGYPAYRNIMKALNLRPIEVEAGADDGWTMTADHIAGAGVEAGVKAVLAASPNNPTGTMIRPDALADIVTACRDRGLWFISDEIYHGLVYDGRAATALAYSDDAIVINSFSKYYCMTGWRIGWMIVPERMVRTVERLAQNLYISAPELSQRAAIAAFEATEELELVKAGYARNRQIMLDAMPKMGFDDLYPVDGAFYVYANVRRFTNDSVAFAREMLDEAGIAATPGLDFDRERGHGFIRFSFAGETKAIENGMHRLQSWLAKRSAS